VAGSISRVSQGRSGSLVLAILRSVQKFSASQ